jgi:hypothetical protein
VLLVLVPRKEKKNKGKKKKKEARRILQVVPSANTLE